VRFSSQGASFRVLGFPVLYRWSALGLPLLFAYLLVQASPARMLGVMVVFVIAIGMAVLVHELGHALAARRFGGQAGIEIVFTGGLTRHTYDHSLTHGQKAFVSVAGTMSGLAVGTIMAAIEPDLLRSVFNPGGASGPVGLVGVGVQIFFLATTYWGVFNLLPLPGLDGAHILDSLIRMVAPGRAGVLVPAVTTIVAVVSMVGFYLWQGLFAALWLLFIFGPELFRVGERIRLGRDEALIVDHGRAEEAYRRGSFDEAAAIAGRVMATAGSSALRQAARSVWIRAVHRLGHHQQLLDSGELPVDVRANALTGLGRLAEAESVLRHSEPTPSRQALLAELLVRQDLDHRVPEILPAGSASRLLDRALDLERDAPALAGRLASMVAHVPGSLPEDRARAALILGEPPGVDSLDPAARWAVETEAGARSGLHPSGPPPDAGVGRLVHERLARAGRWEQALEIARMLGDGLGPAGRATAARSLVGMGRLDEGFDELARAVGEGFADAPAIASDRVMQPLLDDPRWTALAARMGALAARQRGVG
jgi:Zn-dependent protease